MNSYNNGANYNTGLGQYQVSGEPGQELPPGYYDPTQTPIQPGDTHNAPEKIKQAQEAMRQQQAMQMQQQMQPAYANPAIPASNMIIPIQPSNPPQQIAPTVVPIILEVTVVVNKVEKNGK